MLPKERRYRLGGSESPCLLRFLPHKRPQPAPQAATIVAIVDDDHWNAWAYGRLPFAPAAGAAARPAPRVPHPRPSLLRRGANTQAAPHATAGLWPRPAIAVDVHMCVAFCGAAGTPPLCSMPRRVDAPMARASLAAAPPRAVSQCFRLTSWHAIGGDLSPFRLPSATCLSAPPPTSVCCRLG